MNNAVKSESSRTILIPSFLPFRLEDLQSRFPIPFDEAPDSTSHALRRATKLLPNETPPRRIAFHILSSLRAAFSRCASSLTSVLSLCSRCPPFRLAGGAAYATL